MKKEAFIISKTLETNLNYIDIGDGWFFQYEDDLPVHWTGRFLLAGYAWQCLESRESPWEEMDIVDEKKGGILDAEASWSGSYILIADGIVYTDTTGLLSVFYGKGMLSNRLTCLAPNMSVSSVGRLMDWYPGPLTPAAHIKRLLPGQAYVLKKQKVIHRDILLDNEWFYKNDVSKQKDSLVQSTSDLLVTQIKNIAEDGKRVLVPLSGGYDSRSIFAAAMKAGIDMESFTFIHDDMPPGDERIPGVICEKTKVPHKYIHAGEYSPEKEREYRLFTEGLADGRDKEYYAKDYYAQVEKDGPAYILRGGSCTCTTEPYKKYFSDNPSMKEIVTLFGVEGRRLESLEEYMRWCEKHPQKGMSLANRFYLEQRCGVWNADVEKGFALYDGIYPINPYNCRAIITLMFRFPKKERAVKQHIQAIIENTCEEISEIPYSGGGFFKRMPDKIKRLRVRLKETGILSTIRFVSGRERTDSCSKTTNT